jgi:hypothetical protein
MYYGKKAHSLKPKCHSMTSARSYKVQGESRETGCSLLCCTKGAEYGKKLTVSFDQQITVET